MAIEVKGKIREWGGSWGIVLSKEKLQKEHFQPGDEVNVLILPRKGMLEDLWGKDKSLRPTAELMKEVDEEGWDD
jgi:antitoxin component of MazEF toxin-antitoxin module